MSNAQQNPKRLYYLFQDTSCSDYWRDRTQCIDDDHPAAMHLGMSGDDKNLILGKTNYYRSQAEPPARGMPKIVSNYYN